MKKKCHLGFLFATRDDIDDQNWLRRTEELWVYVLTNVTGTVISISKQEYIFGYKAPFVAVMVSERVFLIC
jgi:hypothetical protein